MGMTPVFMLLAVLIFLAYLVGTTAGFGAGVLTLSIGVQFLPLSYLLPVIIPLNILVTLYIVFRHHAYIDRPVLIKQILPLTLSGLVGGMAIYYLVDTDYLKKGYGCFVLLLALGELAGLYRNHPQAHQHTRSPLWLLAGGFFQGLWVSGGPVVVYWANQTLRDKHVFRATLAGMWLVLNSGLALTHGIGNTITVDTLRDSAYLTPAMALGLTAGEWLHQRIPERVFRVLVNILLLAAGAGIILRG